MTVDGPSGFRPDNDVTQQFSSLSRKEAVAGIAFALSVVGLLVVAAFFFAASRSDDPELIGGGHYIADSSGGALGADGPPSFNIVDGKAESRIAGVTRFFGSGSAPSQLIPLNSSGGLYLLDVRTGDLASFTRALVGRPLSPYRMANRGPDSEGSRPLIGRVAGDGVYVIDPVGAGGQIEVRRFSESGLAAFQSQLDADQQVSEVYSPTARAVDGSYLGAVVSHGDLWVLSSGSNGQRLTRFGGSSVRSTLVAADADPIEASNQDLDASVELLGQWPVDPDGDGSAATSLARIAVTGDGSVAVARFDGETTELRFFDSDGPGRAVTFAGVTDVRLIAAVTGGNAAWIVVHRGVGGDIWALGAEPGGRSFQWDLDLNDNAEGRPLGVAAIGDTLVVADPLGAGTVHAFDVGSDDLASVVSGYPLLDGAVPDLSGLTVERVGDRFVVNAPAAPKGLLLDRGGRFLAELVKSEALPVDPDALVAGTEGKTEEEEEEVFRNTTTTIDGDGDAQIVDPNLVPCDPGDERIGTVSNPSTSASARDVTVTWRYTPLFVTTGNCSPSFFVELARTAGGPLVGNRTRASSGSASVIGGLSPETSYAVRVVAEFLGTEQRVESAWVPFATLVVGPDAPAEVRVRADPGTGWRVSWDPCNQQCEGGPLRDGWLVRSPDDPVSGEVFVSNGSRELIWPATTENTGRALGFEVRATSDRGVSDATSSPSKQVSWAAPRVPGEGEAGPRVTDTSSGPGRRTMTVSYTPNPGELVRVFGVREAVDLMIDAEVGLVKNRMDLREDVWTTTFDVPAGADVPWNVKFMTPGGDARVEDSHETGKSSCLVNSVTWTTREPEFDPASSEEPPWTVNIAVASNPSGCATAASLVASPEGCGSLMGSVISDIKLSCAEAKWTVKYGLTNSATYQLDGATSGTKDFSPTVNDDFPFVSDPKINAVGNPNIWEASGTTTPDGVFNGRINPEGVAFGEQWYDVESVSPTARIQLGFTRSVAAPFGQCRYELSDPGVTISSPEGPLCRFTRAIPVPAVPAFVTGTAVVEAPTGVVAGLSHRIAATAAGRCRLNQHVQGWALSVRSLFNCVGPRGSHPSGRLLRVQ